VRPFGAALARIWALPGTILGLLLGATTLSLPRRRDGVLAFERARGFGALHRRMGFAAITLGHVVVASREIEGPLWTHELVHVRQWEILGPLMLAAYPLASVAGYRRNPFEVAARRKAGV
jgi:hypothetical protein